MEAKPLGMTVREAATAIGCSPSTIYRLIDRQLLPCVRLFSLMLIPRRAIEDLFDFDADFVQGLQISALESELRRLRSNKRLARLND